MINHFDPNPLGDPATTAALADARHSSLGGGMDPAPPPAPNVRFETVFDRGWPVMFIVSTRQLPVGSELLLDYGPDYWRGRDSGLVDESALRTAVDGAAAAVGSDRV
jgi:hypothetical protein